MKPIFFDTETTGTGPDDVLFQLAYKTDTETFCQLYNPGKPIPPESSAVHHFTDKMVADKPRFQQSPDYDRVKSLFESDDTVVVAHNAKFDVDIIGREGIVPKKSICTYRVAAALDTAGKFSNYKLQYLRYALGFEIDATAHDALGDVLVLEMLFPRLFQAIRKDSDSDDAALQKMMEISARPVLKREFTFGKHIGKRVADVVQEDRGYLEWLLKSKLENEQGDEDWIYTLQHYLK